MGGPEYDAFARLIREHQLCCECGGECGVSHAKPGLQVGLPMCAHPFGDPDNPITVGHKVPRVAGGDNRWSNLRPECRACNLRKGGR